MLWQDLAITITNTIFTIALIPQIFYGFKNKKGLVAYSASIPTFTCLFFLSFIYSTLELYFATFMSATTGVCWFILFFQRWRYGSVEVVVETKNELR